MLSSTSFANSNSAVGSLIRIQQGDVDELVAREELKGARPRSCSRWVIQSCFSYHTRPVGSSALKLTRAMNCKHFHNRGHSQFFFLLLLTAAHAPHILPMMWCYHFMHILLISLPCFLCWKGIPTYKLAVNKLRLPAYGGCFLTNKGNPGISYKKGGMCVLCFGKIWWWSTFRRKRRRQPFPWTRQYLNPQPSHPFFHHIEPRKWEWGCGWETYPLLVPFFFSFISVWRADETSEVWDNSSVALRRLRTCTLHRCWRSVRPAWLLYVLRVCMFPLVFTFPWDAWEISP